jgi:hypothetical protein
MNMMEKKVLNKVGQKLQKLGSSLLMLVIVLQLFPLQAFALSIAPPAEKVVFQTGRWQFDSEKVESGQDKIWSMYIGDKEKEKVKAPKRIVFSVNQATILSRIHIEYKRSKPADTQVLPQGEGGRLAPQGTTREGEVAVSVAEGSNEAGTEPNAGNAG